MPLPNPKLRHRLGWFVLIWLASTATVAGFAYGLRALIGL